MFSLTWPFYARMGLFVGYGLSLAALIATGLAEGKKRVRELLSRFLIWRVGVRWYLIVLAGPLLLNLTALALHWVSTGAAPDFKDIQARKIFGNADGLWRFAIPFFFVDALTNGEEPGWRGYLLPRLQARFNALVSSLVVGVIWGLWHMPRYWPSDYRGALLAIAHNVPAAILFTWVFNSTGGSLLLVTLLHGATNTAYVFLPVSSGNATLRLPLTLIAVEVVAAVVVVFITGRASLSSKPKVRAATT